MGLKEILIKRQAELVRQVRLELDDISIGRDPECDIVLESGFVSRRHARLRRRDSSYEVIDDGSRNGTFIGGRRVESARLLAHGDDIVIADYVLTFVERDNLDQTEAFTPISTRAIVVDDGAHEVRLGREKVAVALSPQEFALLSFLYRKRGQVCSHQDIGAAVWGSPDVGGPEVAKYDDNMIHRLIFRLKSKVEPDPKRPAYIINIPGIGYRLNERPEVE